MAREDSIMSFHDRVKQLHDPAIPRVGDRSIAFTDKESDPRFFQLKSEIMEEIQTKMIPETVLTNVSAYLAFKTSPS